MSGPPQAGTASPTTATRTRPSRRPRWRNLLLTVHIVVAVGVLGTPWGLARHWWVLAKLVLTIAVATAAVFVLRPALNRAAAQALQVPLAELPGHRHRPGRGRGHPGAHGRAAGAGGHRDPGGLQALGPDPVPGVADPRPPTDPSSTLEFAEAEARRAGFDSIRLYTHEKMTENLAPYSRIGYVEYDRRSQGAFSLVYLRKHLG